MRFIPWKRINKKDDEELLAEFRSEGDLNVLAELFSVYIDQVYGVCLKYLKDREESKDAVMQIFEKLAVEIPKHKINNFRSWLHVVTKNYCLMKLRSEKSDRLRQQEWINDTSFFMENTVDLHPLDREDNNETMIKALEECIERLKEEQKSCIRQFYYENRCYEEISEHLGIDEKKVKSHLQNGKRNLKICLEKKNVI